MPGTFTPRVLADGQAPVTVAAVYTVPAATSAYVKSGRLFNANAATQTVAIFINASGTRRQIGRFVLEQNEHANFVNEGEVLILEAGDTIDLSTTTASAVDYVIGGVVET